MPGIRFFTLGDDTLNAPHQEGEKGVGVQTEEGAHVEQELGWDRSVGSTAS